MIGLQTSSFSSSRKQHRSMIIPALKSQRHGAVGKHTCSRNSWQPGASLSAMTKQVRGPKTPMPAAAWSRPVMPFSWSPGHTPKMVPTCDQSSISSVNRADSSIGQLKANPVLAVHQATPSIGVIARFIQ